MIFEGMGGAGKVVSPNGRFLEPEFAYQGWSADDNGSIYAAYSTQNLCWNKVSRRFSLTTLQFQIRRSRLTSQLPQYRLASRGAKKLRSVFL